MRFKLLAGAVIVMLLSACQTASKPSMNGTGMVDTKGGVQISVIPTRAAVQAGIAEAQGQTVYVSIAAMDDPGVSSADGTVDLDGNDGIIPYDPLNNNIVVNFDLPAGARDRRYHSYAVNDYALRQRSPTETGEISATVTCSTTGNDKNYFTISVVSPVPLTTRVMQKILTASADMYWQRIGNEGPCPCTVW